MTFSCCALVSCVTSSGNVKLLVPGGTSCCRLLLGALRVLQQRTEVMESGAHEDGCVQCHRAPATPAAARPVPKH